MAFGRCNQLENFRLSENIQELGWFCFWGTQITDMEIPPQVGRTPEQLGIGQVDPKVLRLPNGLKGVGNWWFSGSDIEKVIIPGSVESLRVCAFYQCKQLYEVVFEPGSHLKTIERWCLAESGLRKIVIPRTVQTIGDSALSNCAELQEVTFESGSCLTSIGEWCFGKSGLRKIVIPKSVSFIGRSAFYGCAQLQTVKFEPGSR